MMPLGKLGEGYMGSPMLLLQLHVNLQSFQNKIKKKNQSNLLSLKPNLECVATVGYTGLPAQACKSSLLLFHWQ